MCTLSWSDPRSLARLLQFFQVLLLFLSGTLPSSCEEVFEGYCLLVLRCFPCVHLYTSTLLNFFRCLHRSTTISDRPLLLWRGSSDFSPELDFQMWQSAMSMHEIRLFHPMTFVLKHDWPSAFKRHCWIFLRCWLLGLLGLLIPFTNQSLDFEDCCRWTSAFCLRWVHLLSKVDRSSGDVGPQ